MPPRPGPHKRFAGIETAFLLRLAEKATWRAKKLSTKFRLSALLRGFSERSSGEIPVWRSPTKVQDSNKLVEKGRAVFFCLLQRAVRSSSIPEGSHLVDWRCGADDRHFLIINFRQKRSGATGDRRGSSVKVGGRNSS